MPEISGLPPIATLVVDTDVLAIVSGSDTRKVTVSADPGAVSRILATDANGSLALGTDVLIVDVPNGWVGIGGTPTAPLSVEGQGVGGQLSSNVVTGNFAFGWGEAISVTGHNSVVSGGDSNSVAGFYSCIGGGDSNRVDGSYSAIGGGSDNQAAGAYATVCGGVSNGTSANYAFVGGGWANNATAEGAVSVGGLANTASGTYSALGGGDWNAASGSRSCVFGGSGSTASGDYSAILGGQSNIASGDYSFAAGRRAKAEAAGVFVLADSQDADFTINTVNTFGARFAGGYQFMGGNFGIGGVATSKLQVVGLPAYANNAAAAAGGLTAGAFYRTGGDPDLVCVVH